MMTSGNHRPNKRLMCRSGLKPFQRRLRKSSLPNTAPIPGSFQLARPAGGASESSRRRGPENMSDVDHESPPGVSAAFCCRRA